MTLPTIDAELTEQDLAAIEAQFASIFASLPFLVGISPERRKRDIQTGDNDRPFRPDAHHARKALATASWYCPAEVRCIIRETHPFAGKARGVELVGTGD